MNDIDQPVKELKPSRKPGQEIGNAAPPSVVAAVVLSHKADPSSYTRSRRKVYIRKIEKQRINKKLKAETLAKAK